MGADEEVREHALSRTPCAFVLNERFALRGKVRARQFEHFQLQLSDDTLQFLNASKRAGSFGVDDRIDGQRANCDCARNCVIDHAAHSLSSSSTPIRTLLSTSNMCAPDQESLRNSFINSSVPLDGGFCRERPRTDRRFFFVLRVVDGCNDLPRGIDRKVNRAAGTRLSASRMCFGMVTWPLLVRLVLMAGLRSIT